MCNSCAFFSIFSVYFHIITCGLYMIDDLSQVKSSSFFSLNQFYCAPLYKLVDFPTRNYLDWSLWHCIFVIFCRGWTVWSRQISSYQRDSSPVTTRVILHYHVHYIIFYYVIINLEDGITLFCGLAWYAQTIVLYL